MLRDRRFDDQANKEKQSRSLNLKRIEKIKTAGEPSFLLESGTKGG